MNNTFLYRLICIVLFFLALPKMQVQAQVEEKVVRRVGEIITFKDGSQGVVCYVNPRDPSRGWAVALQDLPGTYSMENAGTVYALIASQVNQSSWTINPIAVEPKGKYYTEVLRSANVPAALAVDYYNGWYIPDIHQLRTIYSLMSLPQFSPYKGRFYEETNYGDIQATWSSSIKSITQMQYVNRNGAQTQQNISSKGYIRPVHDFGNELLAGWVDNDTLPTMWVKPISTTTYDAIVVYGKDTITIPGTALVKPAPVLEIIEPDAALCVGSELTLTALLKTPSVPEYNYSWGGDATLTPTQTTNTTDTFTTTSTSLSTPGLYQFYVSVENQLGNCKASDTVFVTAKNFGTVPAVMGDTVCPGEVATLSGVTPGATTEQYYRWYDSGLNLMKTDTQSAGSRTEFVTAPVLGAETYYLSTYDANTCAWDPLFMPVDANYVSEVAVHLKDYIECSQPVVVKSNDCEWAYNGTYRTCEDYTVTYGGDTIPECTTCTTTPGTHQYILPTGDTVTVTDPVSVRDVTDTVNGFEVVIQNPEHYSDIDTIYGNVKVNPIPLVITTDSNEKEYDATPLTDHEWLDTPPVGLAPGDTVVFVDVYGTITEPGDSLNRAYPTAIVVNQTTGDTVTANYSIEYVFGHLVVTPCDPSTDTIYADTLHIVGEDYNKIVANHTFYVTDSGVMTFTDTIPNGAANGCDSITTRVLIVEQLHKDTICQVELATYTWHGEVLPATTDSHGYYEFPGTKVINGHEIDTTSYLLLVVNPDPVVNMASLTDLCPNAGTATLTATVTSATKADYTYSWSGDLTATPTSTSVSTLSAESMITIPAAPVSCGESYSETVTVVDGNGCHGTATVTIAVKTPTKPIIATNAVSGDKGCNPTISAPTFTGTDNCEGDFSSDITVTTDGVQGTGCEKSQTWKATYTDACGNKADTVKVTYTWTEDNVKPVIATTAVSGDKGCNPTTADLAAPVFTLNDNCDATTVVPADSISDSGEQTVGTCGRKRTWIAHYTDPCGNKAVNDTVEYTWTVDATKPVISVVTNSNPDGACNPTITAPTFKVNDNCAGEFALPTDSIIDGGVVNTSVCGRSQTWTAHYTDPCGNKATDVSVTYTWTEDNTAPILHTEAVSDHKGCNPTIVAPTFTVTDNCEGTFVLNADSVTTTGKTGTGCEKTQSWTAHYTDGCGNPAAPLTVTYSWKEDTEKPVIATDATDANLGCDPTTITPPTFSVSDNCEGDFALPTDSVTDGGVVAVTGEPYKFSRTWTAHFTDLCGNKADNVSITYTWVEAPTVTISCPPDVRDTLAFGDCVMNIYPAEIGTPTVNAPADWPMTVSNDIPADNLYSEGETIITWTATDDICGYSVSCEQKVIVVFPQCPDAVDCEGNVYHGVRIDCDCWTQTNLQSNYYGNPGVCEEEIPCNYLYDANSAAQYGIDILNDDFGRLYCPEAGLKDSVVNSHGHIRGICPKGWYLPTPEKYEALNLHGAEALKSPLYWTDGGGDNSTGFTWLPAGWWNGAQLRFEGLTSEGYFLSTKIVAGEISTHVHVIVHDCDVVKEIEVNSGYGYSVRCIKEKD